MTNSFLLALQIALLGMGLVYAAIILLWWMMSLLTWMTAERKPVRNPAQPALLLDSDLKARAAAVAVALALAKQQSSSAHPLPTPPTAIVSAWQLGMRTRQLYQKGPIRRRGKTGNE